MQYLGIALEEYNDKVEASLIRDLMRVSARVNLVPGQQLTVCGPEEIKPIVELLKLNYSTDIHSPSQWISYFVEHEPELPDNAEHVLLRHFREGKKQPRIIKKGGNPFFLKEQGYMGSPTRLIDRPAPNGYTPQTPSFLAIFYGVS